VRRRRVAGTMTMITPSFAELGLSGETSPRTSFIAVSGEPLAACGETGVNPSFRVQGWV